MYHLDKIYEANGEIGGKNTIIEIDETQIGHRKFNKGRLVLGDYIFIFNYIKNELILIIFFAIIF